CLEDNPRTDTAFTCRAVEITSHVEHQVTNGILSVTSTLEAIEHPFVPLASRPWKKLVNRTKIIGTIIVCCPKKVSRNIKKQAAIRKARVRLASERINSSENPFPTLSRLKLENRNCRQPWLPRKEGHHAEAFAQPNQSPHPRLR